jgi:hypothetical protein
MADSISIEVDQYKDYVKSLISEVEYSIVEYQPNSEIAGDVPAWTKYVDGCKNILDTLEQYSQMLLVSARDFDAATDLIIESDQTGAL